ncbi:MAG: Fic family protein [Candidatus Pacearchaeota archaeon]|nr:Fic family protein [Candidatus Pacearchaeota archaeon]
MKYIPPELVHEIRQRCNFLSGIDSAELALRSRKTERNNLKRRAQIHSFRIEHPELRVPYNMPKSKGNELIIEGVRCLENAFQWGREHFDPCEFNETFLQEVAGRVLCGNGSMPYRDSGTRITGASVTPPDPYKMRIIELPWFFYRARELFSSGDIMSIINAAIFSHLHIVRIHPFVDGNGRTARTMQDIILDSQRVPSPIIEVGERGTYYDLLDKAVYDYKHKKRAGEITNGATEGERLFYTFIAGKINASLDKLLSDFH